ncbi:MAG: hypothetical protein WCC26_20445 [Terracidiphilus sp.]
MLAILVVAAIGYFGFGSARMHWLCEQRKAAFDARVEQLKHDSASKLGVGANKERVVRFFQQNGIIPSFEKFHDNNFARGSIVVHGMKDCGYLVCDSDAAVIGVEIEVDAAGAVTAPPRVITTYTDCF